MRSLNQFQAIKITWKNETNEEESQTVPDQAISAPELLRRFATGQPLGFKNVTPVYDDEELDDVPEFYKLSKLDRLHMLQENNDRIKQLSDEVKNYQKAEQAKIDALQRQQQQDEETARLSKTDDKRSAKDTVT